LTIYRPSFVSIVIPTYNGYNDLKNLFPVIFNQKTNFQFEVICVDSSSKDRSYELFANYPVKVCTIPQSEFSHGGTRNLGISKSNGEIIVLITQDALPTDDFWLENIIRNYADPSVAGVYCRQLPKPDGTLLPKIDLSLWITGLNVRRVNRIQDHPDYQNYPPLMKREICNFDDICSSIRRSVWEKHQFREVNFAEDLDWSKRVFQDGYTLVFEPKAKVVHSHDRTFKYEVKRAIITYWVLFEIFDYIHNYGIKNLLRDVFLAPRNLRNVYPEIIQTTLSERFRAYYIVTARCLGQLIYSKCYRNLKETWIGRSILNWAKKGV